MLKLITSILLLLLSVSAQAQTTHVITAGIGNQELLGYVNPSLQAGYSVYRQHGTSEFSGHITWSPDDKRGTGDGNSGQLKLEQSIFFGENFALNGGFRYSHLWTGEFKKGGWLVAPGFLVRSGKGIPFRVQANYLHHIGPTIDKHGVESNLIQGFDISPEVRVGSFRNVGVLYGTTITAARGYNQGNPDCDGTYITKPLTCPRDRWWAATVMMKIRFQIPASGANVVY